jgi:hypothetical protein
MEEIDMSKTEMFYRYETDKKNDKINNSIVKFGLLEDRRRLSEGWS